jgi:hypothetical protein
MIHLIHGIHTGGPSPIEGLIPYIKDLGEVKYPDYGFILGVETRIVNPIVRGTLQPYIGEDDVLICHSNGCAIAYDMLNAGAPAKGVVFINAALEQHITRPPQVKWIDVYYNSGDEATEAAKVAEELGIVDLVWGEMGHGGYKGSDLTICNIDCGNTSGLPKLSGHSAFIDPVLPPWGQFLHQRLQRRMSII